MTTPDFPSYPAEEDDRTVMIPRPGGRGGRKRGGRQAAPSPPPLPIGGVGANSLSSAAAPLLNLITKLSNTPHHQDVDLLREQVLQEIKHFEQNIAGLGIQRNNAYTARYMLCALMDEIVLNTIWGADSSWSRQGMLSTLYKETSGGERFFSIVSALIQDPQADLPLMELAFICLSLGFQGRYRPMPNGQAKLDEIRHRLFEQIRMRRGEFPQELSVRWKNDSTTGRALKKLLPLWVVAAVAGAILVCIYLGFSLVLESNSDPILKQLESIAQPKE